MKLKHTFFICMISALLFTGCQNNDLSTENTILKEKITELEQQILNLEQQSMEQPAATSQPSDLVQSTNPSGFTYSLEELAVMVDEFVAAVGAAAPDINNLENLDQFFSLKRESDKIEHALENYENTLEEQYRSQTITRKNYRDKDKEIEALEEYLDHAADRLEVIFGIDD